MASEIEYFDESKIFIFVSTWAAGLTRILQLQFHEDALKNLEFSKSKAGLIFLL